MKRTIILAGIAFSVFSLSCQKDLDPVMGDPNVRQSETLMAYHELLTSAEYGWNGYIYTKLGGGYSFHFDFEEDGKVYMRGDLNQEMVEEVGESTWRLKSSQQSLLIFDTYSYLHWLSDPDGEVYQGETGRGLESDFEFAFFEVSQDTLHFQGKLNQVDFYMIRSTKEEAESWNSGEVLQMEDQIKQHRFAADGEALKMMINPEKKTAVFGFQQGEPELSIPYTYTAKGINLKTAVNQNGYTFSAVLWDADSQQYYVQSNGTRVDMALSEVPLFSLDELLGYGKEFDRIEFNGEQLDPTLSSGLLARWDQAKENNLLYMGPPTGRELLDYALMQFLDDQQVSIHFRYKHPVEGTLFTVGIWYEMEVNSDNSIRFTFVKHDNNTLFNNPVIMQPFTEEFFAAKSFTLDWIEAGDPDVLVAAMIDKEDETDFFYGMLQ